MSWQVDRVFADSVGWYLVEGCLKYTRSHNIYELWFIVCQRIPVFSHVCALMCKKRRCQNATDCIDYLVSKKVGFWIQGNNINFLHVNFLKFYLWGRKHWLPSEQMVRCPALSLRVKGISLGHHEHDRRVLSLETKGKLNQRIFVAVQSSGYPRY